MLSAPFISGVIIAAKSRAVTYTPVQISGATSDIGHEDWKKREFTTLRREKMELLLFSCCRSETRNSSD